MKLVYIARGATEITHAAGSLALTQGEIAFLPADQKYEGTPPAFVETVTIYIDTGFAIDQLQWLPNSAPFLEHLLSLTEPEPLNVMPHSRAELRRHLRELVRIDATSPGSELQQMARIAHVLGLLQPTDGAHYQPRSQVIDAARLLEQHLGCRWTVRSLANMVALSPSHLTRLFVEDTGLSPSQYLREARAYRMHQTLIEGELNVTEAARTVGWNDPSHASRAYRAVFGKSPSTAKRPNA